MSHALVQRMSLDLCVGKWEPGIVLQVNRKCDAADRNVSVVKSGVRDDGQGEEHGTREQEEDRAQIGTQKRRRDGEVDG